MRNIFLCLISLVLVIPQDNYKYDYTEYIITKENLKTPKREGKFAKFYPSDGMTTEDYSNTGYDRGHMRPYFSGGGDLNGDGRVNDDFELERFKQINAMTNIVPQDPDFNQSGGVWYEIEEHIRALAQENEVHVIVGCIYGKESYGVIGKSRKIEVPPMFFQIITVNGDSTAYLFPHFKNKVQGIHNYVVCVDLIEAMTGFDFALKEEDVERR